MFTFPEMALTKVIRNLITKQIINNSSCQTWWYTPAIPAFKRPKKKMGKEGGTVVCGCVRGEGEENKLHVSNTVIRAQNSFLTFQDPESHPDCSSDGESASAICLSKET